MTIVKINKHLIMRIIEIQGKMMYEEVGHGTGRVAAREKEVTSRKIGNVVHIFKDTRVSNDTSIDTER